MDCKAREHGGKATQSSLSHEQLPMLVARDRASATMDCVLKTMGMATVCCAETILDERCCTLYRRHKAVASAVRKLGGSAGTHVVDVCHVQSVNAYHSLL